MFRRLKVRMRPVMQSGQNRILQRLPSAPPPRSSQLTNHAVELRLPVMTPDARLNADATVHRAIPFRYRREPCRLPRPISPAVAFLFRFGTLFSRNRNRRAPHKPDGINQLDSWRYRAATCRDPSGGIQPLCENFAIEGVTILYVPYQ